MWAKFDDGLVDHPKIWLAGDLLGKNGRPIALGYYTGAVIWSNKHLTDGVMSIAVAKTFLHAENGLAVADALAQAGLFDKIDGGYRIHDYHDHNPSAETIRKKRESDRARKKEIHGNGHG